MELEQKFPMLNAWLNTEGEHPLESYLEENWDSHDGAAIPYQVLQTTEWLLMTMNRTPADVGPLPSGCICIEFEYPGGADEMVMFVQEKEIQYKLKG